MTKNNPYSGLISVVIPTYNWPEALCLILLAFQHQVDKKFEVIIVDDGSTIETKNLIDQFTKEAHFPIIHLWQEDKGFRAAQARNMGIAKAKGEYIVFIDGDCIPQKTFILNHRFLAEEGHFVSGHRIILNQKLTESVLRNRTQLWNNGALFWIIKKLQRKCNKLFPKLTLQFFSRYNERNKWQGVKSCNLGAWKESLYAVWGFDEQFQGWGYEDSDLIIRLLNNGQKRKSGKLATEVFHLWHYEAPRIEEKNNYKRLINTLKKAQTKPKSSSLMN